MKNQVLNKHNKEYNYSLSGPVHIFLSWCRESPKPRDTRCPVEIIQNLDMLEGYLNRGSLVNQMQITRKP